MRYKNLALANGISLTLGRIHETVGEARDMFAVLAAAGTEGPVFWIGRSSDVRSIAPMGLEQFLDPSRLVLVEGVTRTEVLWAAEQALRSRSAATVVIELGSGPDLLESRRLQIAAEEGGGLGIVLIAGQAQTSAAHSRWVCMPAGRPDALWRWQSIKNKTGSLGAWQLTLDRPDGGHADATGVIRLAAAPAT